MSTIQPPPEHSPYYAAVEREEHILDCCLANVRAAEDAGEMTVQQAASARITCLESSLAALRELRRVHLGEEAP